MRSLERQIDKVKRDLTRLDGLRMGSLSEQYNVCGTPGCRCKASPPEKHGPYYQLSYTRKGKSTTRFIRKPNLVMVERQLRNYARLRTPRRSMDRPGQSNSRTFSWKRPNKPPRNGEPAAENLALSSN